MKTRVLGRHILAEFYNCNNDILNDCQTIEKLMNKAAKVANSNVVQSVFHTFNPLGVSGVVVIQESHLAIHTWPEYGYAAVDFFICGETVNPWVALDFLKENLCAERYETQKIKRGI